MDKDHRDLVRRLFTLATEIFEDAHEPISQGQGHQLKVNEYRIRAKCLAQTAQDLGSVAGAISAAFRPAIPARRS